MIVISGALVLVALILLVIGLVSTALGFVYASIAVSVVSFLFLIVGIIQRRGESAPEAAAATVAPTPANDVEGVTAIIPAARRPDPALAETAAEQEAGTPAAATGGAAAAEGTVLVVEGRPRYHVEGCRYLAGKDASVVPVTEARSDGYTACGVCKPDDALAAVAAGNSEDSAAEVTADMAADAVEAPDPVAAARRTTRKAPAKAATKAVKAPAKTAAAKKAPAKKAPAAGSTVVVIPDRGKYHRADCRFVRDASGTEELSKTAAARQGYAACGVCKP